MANNPVSGFPDVWGKHGVPLVDHTGPASYVTGGETLGTPTYGGSNVLGTRGYTYVSGGMTNSGTYRVDCLYGGSGVRSQVKLRWTVVATGAQVAATTNLSAETVRLLVIGG